MISLSSDLLDIVASTTVGSVGLSGSLPDHRQHLLLQCNNTVLRMLNLFLMKL